MHTVSVTREIEAPKAAVWEVLDDFGGVVKYNPGVASSGIVDGPDTGEDATRECILEEGGRIEEVIVDYEPNSAYTVELIDMGKIPLKESIVNLSVTALDDARSEVTMAARFTPKYGPIGWVMAKAMMNSKLEASFGETLGGLASYVETRHHERKEVVSEVASD